MKRLMSIGLIASVVLLSGMSLASGGVRVGNFEENAVVDPQLSQTYLHYRVLGNETIVVVIGDGKSDLDCLIRRDGQTVAEDLEKVDACVLRYTKSDSEPLEIVVRNIGDKPNHFNIQVL